MTSITVVIYGALTYHSPLSSQRSSPFFAPLFPGLAVISGTLVIYGARTYHLPLFSPLFPPLFSPLFTGLAVTSATVVIYGAPIVDPVALLGRMEGVVPICLSLFGE